MASWAIGLARDDQEATDVRVRVLLAVQAQEKIADLIEQAHRRQVEANSERAETLEAEG